MKQDLEDARQRVNVLLELCADPIKVHNACA